MNNRRISLIIPVQNDQNLLHAVLDAILAQGIKPSELLVIDSSDRAFEIDGAIRESFADVGIELRYLHSEPLNPGAARNLGVQQSTGELIAFLDVKTVPPPNWLEEAAMQVEYSAEMGAFGRTFYAANSRLEKWVRAATYGVNPIVTIPGSLFKREVFSIVGSFLPAIVAGEDTDWILRARLHGLALSTSSPAKLTYVGLIGMKFSSLLSKWLRNYRACRDVPYLSDHKAIYLLLFNLLVIFVALNWNAAIAHWNESSPVYVSHITKLTVGTILVLYAGYRGFYLPMHRGVLASYLLPWQWVFVVGVGFAVDVVKVIAFLPSVKTMARRARFAFLRE